MSSLRRLRNKIGVPANPATPGDRASARNRVEAPANPAIPETEKPKISNISSFSRGVTLLSDIDAVINSWLDHIGETDAALRAGCLMACRRDPELRAYLLHRAQEILPNDHARVLQDLQANPGRVRAVEVIDADADIVRLIVAIRDIGVCELLVARDKWDPFKFLALIDAGKETITTSEE